MQNVGSHYFTSMKLWRVYIILLFPLIGFGQTKTLKGKKFSNKPDPEFEIAFTTFNHAERIFDGTTTYMLTDSLIKVSKQYFGDKKSTVVYSNVITNLRQLLFEFKKIRLDSLEDIYLNNCVMATSGDEYFFYFQYGSMKKSMSLHHYYLKEIAKVIQLINSTLPGKYQFRYVSNDTKQDCGL